MSIISVTCTERGSTLNGEYDPQTRKTLIKAGSKISTTVTPSLSHTDLERRKRFLSDGTIDPATFTLLKDIEFKKPSPAAATLCGSPRGGLDVFFNKNGLSLNQLKKAGNEKISPTKEPSGSDLSEEDQMKQKMIESLDPSEGIVAGLFLKYYPQMSEENRKKCLLSFA